MQTRPLVSVLAVLAFLLAPFQAAAQTPAQAKPEAGLPRLANLSLPGAGERAALLAASLAKTPPGTAQAGPLLLGQGVLAALRGDTALAEASLAQASSLSPETADYAAFYLGLTRFKQGRFTEALGLFETAAASSGPVLPAPALYLASLCLERGGFPDEALAALRRFLERADPSVLPYALWRAAALADSLGQQREAGDFLWKLISEIPASPVDAQAMALAARLFRDGIVPWSPAAVSTLAQRAFVLVGKAQFDKALTQIEQAFPLSTDEEAAWLRYLKGKALFGLRRTQAAYAEFTALIQTGANPRLTPFAMLQAARCLWRSGTAADSARMDALLAETLGRYPDSEACPLLRRFLMLGRIERGRFDEALSAINAQIGSAGGARFSPEAMKFAGDQIKTGGRDEFTEQARYLHGIVLFAMGRFEEAAASLAGFAKDWPDSREISGALYWLGQARVKLGDRERAGEAFGRDAAERPNTYYGYKSRQAMQTLGLPDGTASGETGPCPDGSAATLAPSPAGRSALARADILAAASLTELAELELTPASQADPANPLLALATARLATANHRHQAASQAIGRTFAACLAKGGRDALAPIRDMLYPLKYDALIRASLEGTDIPADFVFSLIRQESFFDPAAISRAGAVGLMQVLPETARDLAAKMRESAPGRERLLDPGVNIRYGTAYLKEKWGRLGNPVYLMCDYNAGPAKLNFWRENLGGLDIDLFTELIPYTETRDYVRRIQANMVMYRLLY